MLTRWLWMKWNECDACHRQRTMSGNFDWYVSQSPNREAEPLGNTYILSNVRGVGSTQRWELVQLCTEAIASVCGAEACSQQDNQSGRKDGREERKQGQQGICQEGNLQRSTGLTSVPHHLQDCGFPNESVVQARFMLFPRELNTHLTRNWESLKGDSQQAQSQPHTNQVSDNELRQDFMPRTDLPENYGSSFTCIFRMSLKLSAVWSINYAEKGILGKQCCLSPSCLYSVESYSSVEWLLSQFHKWNL